VSGIAEELAVPVENLLTPDTLRRVMWTPPRTRDRVELLEAVVDQLSALGARSWQVGLTAPALTRAILDAEAESKKKRQSPEPDSDGDGDGEAPSDSSEPSSS
jgi:ribonuclease D